MEKEQPQSAPNYDAETIRIIFNNGMQLDFSIHSSNTGVKRKLASKLIDLNTHKNENE